MFQVNIVLVGWPCKSISHQNNSAASFQDETSKTGAGFKATMDYIEYAKPSVVITENVGAMVHKRKAHGSEVPIEIQNQAMRNAGYDGWHWLLNSKHLGTFF